MGNPKECFSQHNVVHSISGLGIGLILVSLVPPLIPNALVIGGALLVGAIVVELAMKGKK